MRAAQKHPFSLRDGLAVQQRNERIVPSVESSLAVALVTNKLRLARQFAGIDPSVVAGLAWYSTVETTY